jgi:hypothetical protein
MVNFYCSKHLVCGTLFQRQSRVRKEGLREGRCGPCSGCRTRWMEEDPQKGSSVRAGGAPLPHTECLQVLPSPITLTPRTGQVPETPQRAWQQRPGLSLNIQQSFEELIKTNIWTSEPLYKSEENKSSGFDQPINFLQHALRFQKDIFVKFCEVAAKFIWGKMRR